MIRTVAFLKSISPKSKDYEGIVYIVVVNGKKIAKINFTNNTGKGARNVIRYHETIEEIVERYGEVFDVSDIPRRLEEMRE